MIETTALRRKLLDLAISGKLVPKTGEWKTVRLGEVCDILTGNVFDSKKFSTSGIKICGGLIIAPDGIHWEDCKFWSSDKGLEQYALRANDVVVALDRPWISSGTKVGRIREVDLPCLLIQRTARLRSECLDSLLLELLIASDAFKDHCVPTGSTVPHISHKDIATFPIPLPPLAEQKAIVKRLEELLALEREIAADSAALDDLITAAKRKILDLAISGKLVPKTGAWRTVRLLDVCDRVHYGFTASSGVEGNAQLLRITDIQDGHVAWENVPYCMVPRLDLDRYLLRNGDIVIARTGATVGKSYLVEGLNTLSVFASYLIRVIPNETVSSRFLKIFLDSSLYWRQISEKAVGTGQPNVNAEKLKSLEFPLPPLAEQKAIVKRVEELFAVLDAMKGV